MSTTASRRLSGALAGAVITRFGGYPALFVFGALCAVVSGLLMLRIRGIR